MNDKLKHFTACFLITLVGLLDSWFAGVYAATLCAILREYDRWDYTGKLDKLEGFPMNIIWPDIPEA